MEVFVMDILLNDIEVRVLGSLLEKSMTTPEYYPLSLNGLRSRKLHAGAGIAYDLR